MIKGYVGPGVDLGNPKNFFQSFMHGAFLLFGDLENKRGNILRPSSIDPRPLPK
jgi:hypothetical protein